MSKLSPNQLALSIGGGLTALLAGALISASIKSNTGQTIALATFLTVPSAFGIHLLIDSHATKRINQAERRASLAESEAVKFNQDAREATDALTRTRLSLIEAESALTQLQGELERMEQILRDSQSESLSLQSLVANLTPAVSRLESALAERNERVEELEAEVEEWERTFHDRLEAETDARLKVARANELQKIFDEHDAINSQLVSLFKRLKGWAVKVADGHESKRGVIMGMAQAYNQNLEELSASVSEQTRAYLTQIELLQEKVAVLQQRLAGDLLEPQYGEFGYNLNGKIANDIARKFWEELQIPLAVKEYHERSDGSVEVGYGYSRFAKAEALIHDLRCHSEPFAKWLGIHKITNVHKHQLSDLIILSFRREPAFKESEVLQLAGTAIEFKKYLRSNPWRYRLIAEPGTGKTPITAVMVSEYLKVGMTMGNTGRGKRIPLADVVVSCPDVLSSQKDVDYPLQPFLKYGDTTAANKSFVDAYQEWEYRKQNTLYAKEISSLWVWDELDVTINSASDPKATGERLKNLLKQAHHTGMGWIVSGQSVMTKQIPGFMDDDRDLFTEIIIGIPKIRKYLEKYGKRFLSEKVVKTLLDNLDDLEAYIEDKNARITDTARLLRLALILDQKAPKLYLMPNLDDVEFSFELIETTEQAKRHFRSGKVVSQTVHAGSTIAGILAVRTSSLIESEPSNLTIGGSGQSGHCPHCGGADLSILKDGRYRCKSCNKRFVESKVVWR